MGFGLAFAGAWGAANEAAKALAGTIAIGAKVVGQVPVAMAALENQTRSTIQNTRETVTKIGVGFLKTVDITATEWKGWMDVKAAQLLQGTGLPVDAYAEARQAALNNIATRKGWEQKQAASDASLRAMRKRLEQANAQRSAAAQRLKQQIVAKGKATADTINKARKAVDALLLKGILRGGFAAVGKVINVYEAVKKKFIKQPINLPETSCLGVDAPAEQLREQITAQEELLQNAKAATASCGPSAAVLKLEKQIDVSKKALLADNVYEDNRNGADVAPGCHRLSDAEIRDELKLDPNDFHPDGSGFRAAIYKCGDGYTLAYKGTDPSKEQDLENDALQHFGLPSDYYERAQQLAKIVNRKVGPNLEITGHSLGGGLASAAVACLHDTSVRAVVFNPSALNPETVPGADLAQVAKQIDVYQVDGEVLTTLQADANRVGLSPIVVGEPQTALPAREDDGWIERHKMPAVERGLLKQGEATVGSW